MKYKIIFKNRRVGATTEATRDELPGTPYIAPSARMAEQAMQINRWIYGLSEAQINHLRGMNFSSAIIDEF